MRASRPTIVLFDIDGTLLLTGGAGRRAFARAFQDLAGDAAAVAGFSFQGMTDRAIARRGLEALGRVPSEAQMDALVVRYLEALEDELERSSEYHILPGVEALLSNLEPVEDLRFGLGTGNVRTGAEAKLRRGDLWRRFSFGGFGCDHELRAELIAAGITRGASAMGVAPALCRVVVVGDTVLDVAAAHANQAECLAVATGGSSRDELEATPAELVVDQLDAPSVLSFLVR